MVSDGRKTSTAVGPRKSTAYANPANAPLPFQAAPMKEKVVEEESKITNVKMIAHNSSQQSCLL